MTVRVLVVDDNQLIRAGLSTILAAAADVEVVGEAGDGAAAERLVERLQPDVVLMDIEMPVRDGIEATRRLVARHHCRVLVLTMFDLDEYVVAALRAGASGFLLKTADPHTIQDAVRNCAAGHATVTASVLDRVLRPLLPTPAGSVPGMDRLTARELQVLQAVALGKSNAEIGRQLRVAETTVKSHVAHILVKLGVRDRVQAAALAHRVGLSATLEPDPP